MTCDLYIFIITIVISSLPLFSVRVEVWNGLSRDSRPADILVQGCDRGMPAAFDVTVTSPLPVTLNEASVSVGAAVHAAEIRKYAANDRRCQDLG